MVGTMHTGGGNIRLTYLCAEQLSWSHLVKNFAATIRWRKAASVRAVNSHKNR